MMLPGITASPPYFLRQGGDRQSRDRYGMNRLLFCVPFGLSLAFGQFFGLVDPAFTLDPALERQFFVHISNVRVRPCRDLGECRDTGLVQLLLKRRANARQLLEIISTRSGLGGLRLLGCRFLGGLLRLGRGHGPDRARTDRGLDAGLVRALGEDIGHAQQGQLLTVALGPLRAVLAAALDEVDDLVTLDLIDDLGLHGGTRDKGRTDHRRVTAQHQYFVELNCLTGIRCKLFDTEHVTRLHLVLLATGLEDRKHGLFLFLPRSVVPALAGVSGPLATSNGAPSWVS